MALYEIVPTEPYTENDLAYGTGSRVDREQNDPTAQPDYLIWHSQVPRLIYTFLEIYSVNPMEPGIETMPVCVVWAYDPDSVDWDSNGCWWNLKHFNECVIECIVNDAIASLGEQENALDGL